MPLRTALRRRLDGTSQLEDRLSRIERALDAQRAEARRQHRLLIRTQAALDALLRHAFVPLDAVPYPQKLTLGRFGMLSQNGEDGMLLALALETGGDATSFAEIGCGTNGGNSGFLARELGWTGIMVDGSEANLDEIRLRFPGERVRPVHAFVTRETVDELLVAHGLTGDIGLLSIDIDGNDVWVWEAVTAARPRIAVVEYNALFGPSRSVAVPYDAAYTYSPGSTWYGASLAAVTAVSARKGYRLVATEPRGSNAIFLRADVATEIPAVEPEDAYSPLLAPVHAYADPIGPERSAKLLAQRDEVERALAAGELPLVEVD